MEVLAVDELRKIATSEGFQESGSTKVYETILLSKPDPGPDAKISLPIYVEAYLKTGDAAVILPHPRQKAWRLFHFGALNSAEIFRAVLQNPYSDSTYSYNLSDLKIVPPPTPSPLEQVVERQIALIDREISDLQRERNDLFKKFKTLRPDTNDDIPGEDPARSSYKISAASVIPSVDVRGDEIRMPSATSDMLVSRANGDRARGNKGVWSMFYPDAQEVFARAWSAKSVNSVALGRGFVMNYDDGTATWTDISPLLESKLKQQGVLNPNVLTSKLSGSAGGGTATSPSVRIRYIVLGDEGNFYVKFDNGRMEWCGQDSFGAALRRGVSERRLLVEKVAFSQEGGWLIIWSDRTLEAENIPETLEQRLGGTRTDEDRIVGTANGIKDVTLGPAGEWFIIYKDHSVQADNLPDGLYKCLSQIREKSGRVRTIAFGENRSWFVRYWDGNR